MPRNHQIWPEFGISDHCWLIQCPVDGLAGGCGARAVSRKTPIYFIPYFVKPGHPRYLFTKDYAIFSHMIVINKQFSTVINFLFKLFNIVYCSISFPSFYPLDFLFFQQFFFLRTLFTIFSWLLFLENMIICIVQILPVFCLHGLHYEKTSFWSRRSWMQGMLGVPQFWVKIIFGWNFFE